MHDLTWALTGFFGYAAVLASLELLSRRLKLSPEYVRRLSHASAAIFAAVMGSQLSAPIFLAIVAIFIPIMLLSRKKHVLKHIHGVSRPTIGEELLPVGIIVAYLIAGGEAAIFVPAVLVVGIADPLTGIAIQELKSNFIGYLVFLIVAAVIIAIFSSVSLIAAFIIAAIVAGIERLSPYGSDNLTIPLAASLALRLI